MIKRKYTWIVLLLLVVLSPVKADEGMWIPLLLNKYNIKIMQENGFRLTAEDIYSINQACLKDAVVNFGGCTAELISGEGLIITNHHCGYGRIQSHSSVEHDYLTDGFWAMSREEELPNPGLRVYILIRMEDVTDRIMNGLNDDMEEEVRQETIRTNVDEVTSEAVEGTHYVANVYPFFQGNQYFLFVNEIFRDVRLVGAPPSAIGKFGGDTDNWMWPRHTGDFSLFRIYAGKDNKPADFSTENVPYKPKKFFPISLKGVQEGDFTMVFGYPGSTYEYKPSYYLEMLTGYINPEFVDLRGKKLNVITADMNSSPKIRIQYAAKAAGISNSWKRWIGENRGLDKMDAIQKKKQFEETFLEWTGSTPERKRMYGEILEKYEQLYNEVKEYIFVTSYYNEVFNRNGIEAVSFASRFTSLANLIESGASEDEISESVERLKGSAEMFFKNYNQPTDQKLFVVLLRMFYENVDPRHLPDFLKQSQQKFKGDFEKFANWFYRKTMLADEEQVLSYLSDFTPNKIKVILKDPAYRLFTETNRIYTTQLLPEYRRLNNEIRKLDRIYMKAQMEFQPEKVFYPDANSTIRVAYGKVKGYYPRDGVYYTYYTTLKGIIEKDNPDIYDYDVPDKLKELFVNKDFGKYGKNGEMPVCFIATNHTTGGNSGSPVINADGHLIGVNFDRAWEGVMSDLMYNPGICRNISLDIRFALFIIDKFAGAGYLLDEMELVY